MIMQPSIVTFTLKNQNNELIQIQPPQAVLEVAKSVAENVAETPNNSDIVGGITDFSRKAQEVQQMFNLSDRPPINPQLYSNTIETSPYYMVPYPVLQHPFNAYYGQPFIPYIPNLRNPNPINNFIDIPPLPEGNPPIDTQTNELPTDFTEEIPPAINPNLVHENSLPQAQRRYSIHGINPLTPNNNETLTLGNEADLDIKLNPSKRRGSTSRRPSISRRKSARKLSIFGTTEYDNFAIDRRGSITFAGTSSEFDLTDSSVFGDIESDHTLSWLDM